jgi:hypothetical protein
VILKLCDTESFPVKARSHFYSVRSMHTDISLDLCDVKRSRPDGACEVCRVGRYSLLLIARCCNVKDFDLFMNRILFSAFVDSYVYNTNIQDVNKVKK